MSYFDPAARYGFVLSGGGLTGIAAQTGALLALQDAGVVPKAIVGLSAGSVVGGLYASGRRVDEIASLLISAKKDDFWDPLSPTRLLEVAADRFAGQTGYLRGERFRGWLRKELHCKRISECEIPFRPVAVNLSTLAEEAPEDGDLAAWIRASTAIPFVFRAEEIDGEVYVDGGVTGSIPVDVMADQFGKELALDRILVLTTIGSATGEPQEEVDSRFLRRPWTPVRLLDRVIEAVRENQKRENWESGGIPVDLMFLEVPELRLDEVEQASPTLVAGHRCAQKWMRRQEMLSTTVVQIGDRDL